MKIHTHSPTLNTERGFSLVEMAVVLVILGFVIAALLLPLQAQRNQFFQTETENQLEIARKALIGFAQSRGRLPCPAIATSNGIENPIPATGTCTSPVGFLPAATLGIQPTDKDGFAIDGWNNRLRYAVSQVNTVGGAATPDFTTTNEMNNVTIAALDPDLRVCENSSVADCSTTKYLTNNAVVVIYSSGPNGSIGGGADEANQGVSIPPTTFYSRTPTAAGSTDGEFDDLVVWISPYVLYNAMIEAGQLH